MNLKPEPRGICPQCIDAASVETIPLPDGGKVVGLHCWHHDAIATRREFPDGQVSQWRGLTPAALDELEPTMRARAAAVRLAANLRADESQQRPAGNVN